LLLKAVPAAEGSLKPFGNGCRRIPPIGVEHDGMRAILNDYRADAVIDGGQPHVACRYEPVPLATHDKQLRHCRGHRRERAPPEYLPARFGRSIVRALKDEAAKAGVRRMREQAIFDNIEVGPADAARKRDPKLMCERRIMRLHVYRGPQEPVRRSG